MNNIYPIVLNKDFFWPFVLLRERATLWACIFVYFYLFLDVEMTSRAYLVSVNCYFEMEAYFQDH